MRLPKKSSAGTGGVAAVDRALMLLCAFRDGDRALSLSELSERTQLVKSTTLRLLASLGHFGFVQRGEDGAYSLGPEVARLQGTFAASLSLETVVMPALHALAAATGETAVFHVLRGGQRISLYRVNSSKPLHVHVQVGDVMPLDRGAGGRVLTAFSGGRGAIYERIRRDGYASLQGDRVPDLAGISAPVLGPGAEVVGAVTLTYPSHRHKDRFLAPVREAARAVGAKLGGTDNQGNPK